MEAALLILASNEQKPQNKGVVARTLDYYTDGNINLSVLWDNEKKFKTQITELKKKYKLGSLIDKEISIVYRNKDLWTTRDGKINIFKANREDEESMDELLQMNNSKEILALASKGNLTENFLKWLIKERIEFNKTRKQGKKLIKIHSQVNFTFT